MGYGADEDSYGFAGAYEEENDWDEYEDEIGSAIAFASHQETSADERDWDEEQAEMERWHLEAQESSERWQDWAAVDEIEDDESYQWSEDEEEEY
ncbi:MAG: hypothetical protein OXM03_09190 [Chloroflexota bacterium]|nr:hypothetical protein [Chloroflexota bacterium]MDE2840787.1 hypothetical protein [Chloroflexota bacterium]MDE2930298.1 hypothetical protein [Chloroflexota bacterium]